MKTIKFFVQMLFIGSFASSSLFASLKGFDKEDIVSVETAINIKHEKWPDWSVKYGYASPTSISKKLPPHGVNPFHDPVGIDTEEKVEFLNQDTMSDQVKFEMTYPISRSWKAGFEFTFTIPSKYKGPQSSVEFADTIDIYDLTLTKTFNIIRGPAPLYFYAKTSSGLSLARLSLATLAGNCPSFQEQIDKNKEAVLNLFLTGYSGLNVGASVGYDWYLHPWFALTGEVSAYKHALLYHPFATEKLFPHQFTLTFGVKTIF